MKVRITATEVVEYNQIVEMSEEDFASYEEARERREGIEWLSNFAERFLDIGIGDSEGFDDVKAEKFVEDANEVKGNQDDC